MANVRFDLLIVVCTFLKIYFNKHILDINKILLRKKISMKNCLVYIDKYMLRSHDGLLRVLGGGPFLDSANG